VIDIGNFNNRPMFIWQQTLLTYLVIMNAEITNLYDQN
jgi:hypothetical protein